MSSMRQNVSHTVDGDVLEDLRKMSTDYVRQAADGEIVGTSSVQAAQDAMALQDTLHGHAQDPERGPPRRSRADLPPSLLNPESPLHDRLRSMRARHLHAPPRHLNGRSAHPSPSFPSGRALVTAQRLQRTRPSPRPPARRDSVPAVSRSPQLTQGAGLPELLRREPSDVIAEARQVTRRTRHASDCGAGCVADAPHRFIPHLRGPTCGRSRASDHRRHRATSADRCPVSHRQGFAQAEEGGSEGQQDRAPLQDVPCRAQTAERRVQLSGASTAHSGFRRGRAAASSRPGPPLPTLWGTASSGATEQQPTNPLNTLE